MSDANGNGGASNEVRQFTIGEDDDGIRLDRWFKRNLPQVGFATVSRWARTGQIRVDGKRAAPEDRRGVCEGGAALPPPVRLASTLTRPRPHRRPPAQGRSLRRW